MSVNSSLTLALIAASGLACHSLAAQAADAEPAADVLSYTSPPEWVAWMEGEDAVRTNWRPGELRHVWWHEYAGVSGRGTLLLAADKLPDGEDSFYAEYEFDLPADGTYELYWRGRFPGYQACPIRWSVNGGELHFKPRKGESPDADIIDRRVNSKVVLAALGSFKGKKGKNLLRIEVSEPLRDVMRQPGHGESSPESLPFFVQAIDSLSVSKVRYEVPQERVDVVRAPEGEDFTSSFVLGIEPAEGQHRGQYLPLGQGDWSTHDTLSLALRVFSQSREAFDARLRVLYAGSQFVDLPVRVEPSQYGDFLIFTYPLPEAMKGIDRSGIHALWFYTYDAWFTEPAAFGVDFVGASLSGPNERGRQPVAQPLQPRPVADAKAAADGVDGFVWNVARDTTETSSASPGDQPDAGQTTLTAGKLTMGFSNWNAGPRTIDFGGRVLADVPAARPLIEASFLDDRMWSPSKGGAWKQINDSTWRWELADDGLRVRLTATTGNNEIRIIPEITNTSEVPVSRVAFQLFPGLKMNGSLIAGTRNLPFGSYNGLRSEVSPQLFTNDWFCAYDSKSTIHVRIEDDRYLDSAARYGRPDGTTGIVASIEKFPRILPGATWTAPPVVYGADDSGSWYVAAEHYRDWFWKSARRPFVPEWFQGIGAITVGFGFYEQDALEANARNVRDAVENNGQGLFHAGNWMPLQTEAWYPLNYRLDDTRLEHFKKVAEGIREAGGRISIYTNALMFSMATPDYVEYGEDHEFYDRDGFPYGSEHQMRHHPMSLPWPDAKWAKRFGDAIERTVVEGRPDALYIDQLGAVPTHLNFSPEKHGIDHYGLWRAAQKDFAAAIDARLRPQHPDLVTGIENPNIAAQQYITYALLSYNSDQEVMRVLFPWFVHAVGYYDNVDEKAIQPFAEEAFLGGMPLLYFTGTAENLPPASREDLRQMLEFKKKVDPVLYKMRCRGADGVQAPEGLRAFTFAGDDALALTFVRAGENAPRRLLLDPVRTGVTTGATARMLNADGQPGEALPLASDGDQVVLDLPDTRFGAVIFQK